MTSWYVVSEAYGDAEIYGPFKTKRDAVWEAQCQHDTAERPKKNWAGNYELAGAVITTDPSSWTGGC